jgi:hypothetical protein
VSLPEPVDTPEPSTDSVEQAIEELVLVAKASGIRMVINL